MTTARFGAYAQVAFWIAPAGTVHRVVTHVLFICDHPGLYGETEESLRGIYRDYGESFRDDGGSAREEIVGNAIGKGWVRTRRYAEGWFFSLNGRPESLALLASLFAAMRREGLLGYRETNGAVPVRRTGSAGAVSLDAYLVEHPECRPLRVGFGAPWNPDK